MNAVTKNFTDLPETARVECQWGRARGCQNEGDDGQRRRVDDH
jgi:hypothetical protein